MVKVMVKTAHKKRIFFFVITLLLALLTALTVGFFGMQTANAQDANQIDVSRAHYHFFSNPNAIAASGNYIFIADGQNIYRYSFDTATNTTSVDFLFEADGEVSKMLIVGGRLFVLELPATPFSAPVIAVYNMADGLGRQEIIAPSPLPNMGFTNIATSGNYLFATHALSSYLFAFNILTLNFARYYPLTLDGTAPLPASTTILGLVTGSGDNIFITHSIGGNLYMRRFTRVNNVMEYRGSLAVGARLPFAFISYVPPSALDGDSAVLIFARDEIYLATTEAPIVHQNIGSYSSALNSIAISGIGRRLFKLDNQGTLSSFSIDGMPNENNAGLSDQRILLASRSGIIPGFFDTPNATASSNGKVFVADTLNNRITVRDASGYLTPITINRPIAITARYGRLVVATSDNRLYHFDIRAQGQPVQRGNYFRIGLPATTNITALNLCSYGHLFVLDSEGVLRSLSRTQLDSTLAERTLTVVQGLSSHTVVAIASGAWASTVYIGVRDNLGGYSVLQITPGGTLAAYPIIYGLANIVDIAVDFNSAIYVLGRYIYYNATYSFNYYIYRITRHALDESSDPAIRVTSYYEFAQNSHIQSPIAITLSLVDFRIDSSDTVSLAHRDILVTDRLRHRVEFIRAYEFSTTTLQVLNPFIYEVDNSLITAGFYSNTNSRLHTLVGTANLYLNATDVFAARRSRQGQAISALYRVVINRGVTAFTVIVPFGINPYSDFTFVIADNLFYTTTSQGEFLSGYILTSLISSLPIPHISAADSYGNNVYMMPTGESGIRIYKFPTARFSVSHLAAHRTRLTMLDFIGFTYDQELQIGYFDNHNRTDIRPRVFNHWVRVSFEYTDGTGNTHTFIGYTIASNILPYAPDRIIVEPAVPNATIIRAYFDPSDATGARFFSICPHTDTRLTDAYGNPVSSYPFNTIAFGRRVTVLGTFSTANTYTRIRYNSASIGTIEVYVRTPNIDYDGINLLELIVIILAGITTILTGIWIGRYLQIKKGFAPKKPAESFV